jgi:hypothetical protein
MDLTGERGSRPFELSATQTQTYRNFAVGFYNDKGGYTLGEVWHDPAAPNTKGVSFPEGTVPPQLFWGDHPLAFLRTGIAAVHISVTLRGPGGTPARVGRPGFGREANEMSFRSRTTFLALRGSEAESCRFRQDRCRPHRTVGSCYFQSRVS